MDHWMHFVIQPMASATAELEPLVVSATNVKVATGIIQTVNVVTVMASPILVTRKLATVLVVRRTLLVNTVTSVRLATMVIL